MTTQLLDSIPTVGVFVLFAIVTVACYEVGFRVGRWWQDRLPGEQEGPTEMLVGSLLALMAFLLAVTMGMAADRFDARRGLVLAEANAIGTAYLQADYLTEPAAEEMKELLREYLPLRIVDDHVPGPGGHPALRRAARGDVGDPGGGGPLRPQPGSRLRVRRLAVGGRRPQRDAGRRRPVRPRARDRRHPPARRLGVVARHGGLQCRPQASAERPERRRSWWSPSASC